MIFMIFHSRHYLFPLPYLKAGFPALASQGPGLYFNFLLLTGEGNLTQSDWPSGIEQY